MPIIFDFNGTMFFDGAFQKDSWKTYLEAKIHRPVTEEEFNNYLIGRNMCDSMAYFFHESFSPEKIAEMEEEKEAIYRELCLNSSDFHLAPGLEAFLDECRNRQIPMTIATASGWNNVCFFFEHLRLDRWFDLSKVVYNNGKIKGKPAPDFYLRAAEVMSVPIEDCIIFEDSNSGLLAARRSGARKVICLDPKSGPGQKRENADLVIRDFTEQRVCEIIASK